MAFWNEEHELQAVSLGLSQVAVPLTSFIEARGSLVSVRAAISSYLEEVRRFRSPKTISSCERVLALFGATYSDNPIAKLTRKDLLDHMHALKQRGLADRTIYNHLARIGTLLRANGVNGLLSAADKPRYEEKEVEAYTTTEVSALFCAADFSDGATSQK